MPRIRMTLSLEAEDYAELTRIAHEEHTLPATLAARLILREIRRRSPRPADPLSALTDWLGPRIDAVREAGAWPPDVMIDFYEAIEREAPDLYAAAEADVGRLALNPNLGRFMRARLGAVVVMRNGRPHVRRVPTQRSTLIQTVTLLKPSGGARNDLA